MKRARTGFTILEAVVALAIVGLVCVGVLGAFGEALRIDARAAGRIPLAALAQERLAAVDIFGGSLERLPDSLARGKFAPPHEGTTWRIGVRAVERRLGLYELDVNVRDNDGEYRLITRRYRNSTTTAIAY